MKYLEKAEQNIWIIGILSVATFLRFYKLGFQGAWLDEVHTLRVSDPALSFSEFYDVIIFSGGIPHFYFLIIRFLSDVFGSSILVARIPSAIAGVLTVWVIYLLAKELKGKRAGAIAALFLTLNFVHIEYSQEARSYTILAFFASLAFYRMVRFINETTFKNALIMGFCSGLIAHAQPVGLINAATIYLILFFVLIFGGYKAHRKMFLCCFSSGIVAILVASPVYPIIKKIPSITAITNSFIPKFSADSLSDLFITLSSGSKAVLLIFVASTIFLGLVAIKSVIHTQSKNLADNKLFFAFTVAFLWFGVEFSSVVLKSYYGDSILLPRYLLAIVPSMMLILAIAIDQVSNTIFKIISIAVISGLLLSKLVLTNYYTTKTKSEYKNVTDEIIKDYNPKDKIVSNWGWVLGYYFDEPTRAYIIESDFHEYVNAMKVDAVVKRSFWYVDGNFRPYDLNSDEERFLNENFIIDHNIDKYYNAWARHYKLKATENKSGKPIEANHSSLIMEDFEPYVQNIQGYLIMYENGIYTSKEIKFEDGQYELAISGYSLPEVPINGENAHISVKLGDNAIGQLYLSENPKAMTNKLKFNLKNSQMAKIKIVFDNDFSVDGKDRNAIITGVSIEKTH